MNKYSDTSGSTSFGRIRSLVAFRHHNPFARLVSTVVAFAIAMLLVVGSGPAFAEDTAPAPAETTDTTLETPPAEEPAPEAPQSEEPPAEEPVAETPAPADNGGITDKAPAAKTSTQTTSFLAQALITSAQALVTPISNTGGFEIDGDTIVGNNGGTDWVAADKVSESYRDAAGYQGTNKLADDPSTWSGAQVATEKMDMVNLWVRTLLDGPRGAFGIQRDAANGTTAYYFEYNHLPNLPGNVAKPQRSANDVMFGFTQSGNNTGNKLSFDQGYVYALTSSPTWNAPGTTCTLIIDSSPAGGWCTLNTSGGVFYGETSDGLGGGATGTYPTGIFAEGIVDFSKLNFPQGSCLGALGHLNVRSQSSLEWTSAMQDFATASVNVPTTCGSLTVLKKELTGDTLIPGAIYSIVDDPRPGETGTYRVFDGTAAQLTAINASANPAPGGTVADGSDNGKIEIANAEPGTYTVTELRPPAGYLLPADPDQVVIVGAVGSNDPRNPVITFRDPMQFDALTATKTAQGDYDTTYTWNITKGVRSGADAFAASASKDSTSLTENFDWKVSIGEGTRTENNHVVSGAITISNPNSSAVLATITESLTDCTIYDPADTDPPLTELVDASGEAGFQVSVPANGGGAGTAYQYACDESDKSATSNTATVTVDRSDYPRDQDDVGVAGAYSAGVTPGAGNTLSPSITWTEHADGTKTIEVTDVLKGTTTTHANSGAPWTHTWGDHADPTWNGTASKYEHVYSSPVTTTAGACASVTNTATITDTGQSAEATATHCAGADLVVTKNRTASLERTYLWQIEKNRTSAAQITSGQSASYSVTVSRGTGDGYQDSGWYMDGFITVTNPNDWAVTLTGVTDEYDGDNDAANSCDVTASRADGGSAEDVAINYIVPADGSYQYKYVCDFESKPDYDGTNTATATWSAATAHTPTGTDSGTAAVATADWSLASTANKVITVTDNAYTGGTGVGGHTLGTVDWDDAPETFTYSMPWTAPAGECDTKPNTATIVETDQNSSASVLVCNPVDLVLSKTAAGDFTRTYRWDLDKVVSADPSSDPETWTDAAKYEGDQYSHVFGYLVTLSQLDWVDSAWEITGTITVTNPNTDSDIAAISSAITEAPEVGADATCVVDGGPDDGDSLVGYSTGDIASGGHVDVDYRCTFDAKPDYTGGHNVVTGTNASNSPHSVDVTFTKSREVDKTVSVVDDKVTLSTPEELDSVTYEESDPDKTYTWDYTLEHTATAVECQGFTNTAKVFSDDPVLALVPVLTLLDTARATATICPEAGTWEVAKTSDVGDGAVPTDSDITYTLTAHKTGGVNPTDVVLYDDLSDLVPYIDAFVPPAAPAGTTVDYDPSTHVLTWTIGELGDTDETLDFTVHVKADAYGVDLPNLVTSPGSDNCPDEETVTAACTTDNDTPHFTLDKSSDAGAQVMPPYLDALGTVITYTLTVHNDSDVPINSTTLPGATVTDDLSEVLDDAVFVAGSLDPAGQAELNGSILTWTLPEIAVDETVTLTYQVRVAGDQWDETLTNVAEPGDGGDCVEEGACTTTTITPRYALIQAIKVDADDEQQRLEGAVFTLSHGQLVLETGVVSDANGIVHFTSKLQPGTFQVTETAPPVGYSLPADPTQDVVVTAADLDYGTSPVEGAAPVQIVFEDPPVGSLALSKAHQELSGGTWVPGDGQVAFNDQVKYVITVTATGTKMFHDVMVTDYVPGYNPADSLTQLGGFKGVIDPASVTCSAVFATCTTDYDPTTGMVTWSLGDVGNETGTVEFVVRMPDLPRVSPLAGPGVAFAGLMWNQAYLSWTQRDDDAEAPPHTLASNEVTDAANEVLPPEVVPPIPPAGPKTPNVLPATGGPDQWLLLAGLVLLLGGGTVVAADRRRKHRS